MHRLRLGIVASSLLALTGCGTVHNLMDRPTGTPFLATGRCTPFGGVLRSGMLALGGPTVGIAHFVEGAVRVASGETGAGFKDMGSAALLASAGLVAIVDTPLSLAGDIVTLPIAFARSQEFPWATWWGQRSEPKRTPQPPSADDDPPTVPADTKPLETPSGD